MAAVVCVHGIGQQHLGARTLSSTWTPALLDGLPRQVPAPEIAMAFYGNLFRPPGSFLAVGDPLLDASDVRPGLEQDLLAAWWAEAAAVDERVAAPDVDTLVAVPGWVQRALAQLSNSRFFAGVALRSMVFDLKQVARYLTEPDVRDAARTEVAGLIGQDTRVVVAHSLGSVVAYETLCVVPDHQVRAFVTLGSPLGIANLVYHRLEPAPGVWPGDGDLVWTNVADAGDVVALVKDLRPRFGDRVRNALVHNGARAHAVVPYLTDAVTGAAIAEGLA